MRVMPRSDHGTTPTIIATKARKKTTSTAFWRPLIGSAAAEFMASALKWAMFASRSLATSDLAGSFCTRRA